LRSFEVPGVKKETQVTLRLQRGVEAKRQLLEIRGKSKSDGESPEPREKNRVGGEKLAGVWE